jgi:hypothetical protein
MKMRKEFKAKLLKVDLNLISLQEGKMPETPNSLSFSRHYPLHEHIFRIVLIKLVMPAV